MTKDADVITNVDQHNAVTISGLSFGWNNKEPLLMIPHWSITKKSRVFIQGASGSGKSTFLNLLAGIVKPTQGSIHINGVNISQLSERKKDQFRTKNIGVIFQQFNLIGYLSVFENIYLVANFSGENQQLLKERASFLLDRLGIAKALWHKPARLLSVGQQQRVAVVRALMLKPTLIIADEPSSALDVQAREQFINLLLSVVEDAESTLLLVSHDPSLAVYFNHHIQMKDFQSATEQLKEAKSCY